MSGPALGPRFVTVWAGQTLSSIGSALSGVGVAVYVFVETGSAASRPRANVVLPWFRPVAAR